MNKHWHGERGGGGGGGAGQSRADRRWGREPPGQGAVGRGSGIEWQPCGSPGATVTWQGLALPDRPTRFAPRTLAQPPRCRRAATTLHPRLVGGSEKF